MTKQVEFFETNNIWKLQEQVNKFLMKLSEKNNKEVSYNHMSSHLPRENDDDWNVIYTAMVAYDPDDLPKKEEDDSL